MVCCSVDALYIKRGRSVVIGRTVSLVSSVARAPDLQAGGVRGSSIALSTFFPF